MIEVMKIYISHSSNYDFDNELYGPLKQSPLSKNHTFYFPHDKDNVQVDARPIIKESDLIIAECSQPSTGQGIELGWASVHNTPIICIYLKNSRTSNSLNFITKQFIEYENLEDMIKKLENYLASYDK